MATEKLNNYTALYSKTITIIDDFVGHKNWIDTYDDRIQLYWECTNSTLPFIVLESIGCKRNLK